MISAVDALGLLTRRQIRVLQLLPIYNTDSLIAFHMGVCTGTVKMMLARLRDRLDNKHRMTRIELAMLGRELNDLAKNPDKLSGNKHASTVEPKRVGD